MTDRPGQSSQHQELADALRGLRVRSGFTGKDFAARLGWAASKVSRLEHAERLPSRDDVERWATACSATAGELRDLLSVLQLSQTDRQEWRRRARQGLAALQIDYNDLVAHSQTIRYFETALIPGFLQIPAYARRVLAEMSEIHDLPAAEQDAAVGARLRRTEFLYDGTKTFVFLIAEPVLRWGLCPPDVMRAQLDRLLTAADLPTVQIAILPLDTPLATTPQHSFQLYDDLAIVDTVTMELVFRDDEAATYTRLFDRLFAQAVAGKEAKQLILNAVKALGHQNGSLIGS